MSVCVLSHNLNCVFNDGSWDEDVSMETNIVKFCSSLHLSDCGKIQCTTKTGNNISTVNTADTTASDAGAGCGHSLIVGLVI